MDFARELLRASKLAARKCRKIALSTGTFVAPNVLAHEYASESEAAFKALTYGNLLKKVSEPNELCLEPMRFYLDVDLAYCKGGLTWQQDNSKIHLVEVKRVSKKKRSAAVLASDLNEVRADLENLHRAHKKFTESVLTEILAFIDIDAGGRRGYSKKLEILRPAIENDLGEQLLAGVNLVMC
jgi:hypothetical protein